jgi:sialate O-acetylesterase
MVSVQGAAFHPFNDILIGEVWMCSGQSNMQMSLAEAYNGASEVAASTNPAIRLLRMPYSQSVAPTNDFTASWQHCNPTSTATFSAIGYYFACLVQKELGVPVGMVSAAIGGTAIEIWMAKEWVEDDPVLKANAELRNKPNSINVPYEPGAAYNTMIYPLRNLPIAGVIWNHGTANQDYPDIYMQFVRTLVSGWREDYGTQLPFYISQIAPYKRDKEFATKYSNPLLRNNQTLLSEELAFSGVAVNDDVANINDIHPVWKREVGERLAFLALGQHYGKADFETMRSPIYDSHQVSGNKLTVSFKYATDGLKTTDSQAPNLFEICGADKVFYPATATIAGSTVELTAAQVAVPVAARMGWKFKQITNMRGMNGLPVSVFRTYTWEDTGEDPDSL